MPARKRSSSARDHNPPPRGGSTQAAKIQRWIDLIAALLGRHYGATFEELRRYVPAYGEGRSRETILRMFERDKDELRELGVAIETIVDDDGEPAGYRLRARDFYLPYLIATTPAAAGDRATRSIGAQPGPRERPGYRALQRLQFEPEELAAVADAAERVRQLEDPVLAADADSAIRKLAFDLPVGALAAADQVMVVPGRARASERVFEQLDMALRHRKVVTFDYHSMERDETTRRTAEPRGLFFLGGHWYLAARDRDRDALRNFRLNRIAKLEVNEKRAQSPDFEIPSDFDLREHARSRHAWELGEREASSVVVEFNSQDGVAVAAARLGDPVDGDGTRRRFTVRREGAFVRWLLSFAGDAVPVSPGEVVAAYRECARETLALYEQEPER